MNVTVFGRSYSFANSPKFVRHAIKLIVDKWGSDLSNAQAFVKHKAYDLAVRFGTLG
jgi:hypothetical protein